MSDLSATSKRFAFAPPSLPVLPIRGSENLFPVHRIYCVGRNYAEHAREMGHDPSKEPPFFFQKNPDNIVTDGVFPYPRMTSDAHFEIEMIVALHKGGSDIPVETALDHVFGYGIGLDMTRRDLQGEAKKLGRPWEVGKAFDASAPCGPLVPASEIGHLSKGRIQLTQNGVLRQEGDLDQMIWKVPEMISYLSTLFTLQPGTLIMSGTPSGVGPVARGDVLEGFVEGLGTLETRVV